MDKSILVLLLNFNFTAKQEEKKNSHLRFDQNKQLETIYGG